jgi:hypothetical protein
MVGIGPRPHPEPIRSASLYVAYILPTDSAGLFNITSRRLWITKQKCFDLLNEDNYSIAE